MIDNPDFKNEIDNPHVTLQMGETEDGRLVAIYVCKDEDGGEVTMKFTHPQYLEGVATLMLEGVDFLAEPGLTDVAAKFVSDSQIINTIVIPDDASSLDQGDTPSS